MEVLLRCCSNIPVCLVYWVLTLVFFPTKYGNRIGALTIRNQHLFLISYFVLGDYKVPPTLHVDPTVLWLEERQTIFPTVSSQSQVSFTENKLYIKKVANKEQMSI